jgi:hypothetical protein
MNTNTEVNKIDIDTENLLEENLGNEINNTNQKQQEIKTNKNLIERNLTPITIFLWTNKIFGIIFGTIFLIIYSSHIIDFERNDSIFLPLTIAGYSYTMLMFWFSYLKYIFVKEKRILYFTFNIVLFLVFLVSIIIEVIFFKISGNCSSPRIIDCIYRSIITGIFLIVYNIYFCLLNLVFMVFILIFDILIFFFKSK